MEWERAIGEERAALGRIVALLCALADLAERAAGRSPIVRSLVLWFLRHAETVARDFVEGGAHAPATALSVAAAGTAPRDAKWDAARDAIRLAISLRALARQLERQAGRLAAMGLRTGGEPATSCDGPMPPPRGAFAFLSPLAAVTAGALPPPRALDTS